MREGETKWEDLDLDDMDLRMKWAGLFHRRKRAPGTFMMRLKVRACAASVASPAPSKLGLPARLARSQHALAWQTSL